MRLVQTRIVFEASEAVLAIKEGEVVAVPTETVYGLAADGLNPDAVSKIFSVKGRPQDNPLILHITDEEMWGELVENIPEKAKKLAAAFWPGPLTIILKKSGKVPDITSGGLDTVGVRMPDSRVTLELIRLANTPLAAPSANISGRPSPTNSKHCLVDLDSKIPFIVEGGECRVGIESTIISLVDEPLLLRPGVITAEELSEVLGEEVIVSSAVLEKLAETDKPLSPGMKYRHYSPKAKVIIVDGDKEGFMEFLSNTSENAFALVFDEDISSSPRKAVSYGSEKDSLSQARRLFSSLRELDELGAEIVYARLPSNKGIGLGVYNRMLRAAGFDVIKL